MIGGLEYANELSITEMEGSDWSLAQTAYFVYYYYRPGMWSRSRDAPTSRSRLDKKLQRLGLGRLASRLFASRAQDVILPKFSKPHHSVAR